MCKVMYRTFLTFYVFKGLFIGKNFITSIPFNRNVDTKAHQNNLLGKNTALNLESLLPFQKENKRGPSDTEQDFFPVIKILH